MEDYRHLVVSVLSGSAGQILVAEVQDRRLSEPGVVQEFYYELVSLLKGSPIQNLLLDLARVEYVSSGCLNRLIDLQDQIDAGGGKLRLCGLQADVAEIFAITRLDRHFRISRDQSAALTAF